MSKKDIDPFYLEPKKSKYTSIDSIIRDWARKHQLKVLERYQDYEIRLVQIGFMTKGSRSFEININPPDLQNNVEIIIRNTNPPYNSEIINGSENSLEQNLEKALRIAKNR